MQDNPIPLPCTLERPPEARALVKGSAAYPELRGEVLFYPFLNGSLLLARITGLPGSGFFGFHIHAHADCRTGGDTAFHSAGGHWDPAGVPHPGHAGDLPVLLADHGLACAMVYTGRFTPAQAVGRSVIIHSRPDDYRSQPAGDSGERIACGAVEALHL